MTRLLAALVLGLALVSSAHAVQPEEILRDPRLEERARAISANLRCMVCQNESIDASNAPLARDLRILVRERLVAGDSNDQIYDFLVSRYGDFVLLRPRFTAQTALLWVGPVLVLVLGAGGIWWALRRRREAQAVIVAETAAPLSPEEQARLKALLDAKG